jgi:hypothetical protein
VCNIKESDLGVNQAKTVWQLGGCTLGAAKGYTATLSAYKKLVAKAARAKKQGKVSTAAVVMGDNPYVIEMDPTTCLTQCPTLKVPTPDGTKGLRWGKTLMDSRAGVTACMQAGKAAGTRESFPGMMLMGGLGGARQPALRSHLRPASSGWTCCKSGGGRIPAPPNAAIRFLQSKRAAAAS